MALYGHGYDEKALPFPLKAYGALTNMSDLLAFWGIRIQRQRFRPHRPRKDSEAMWMSMACIQERRTVILRPASWGL